jgi:hypothetical protein
LLAREQDENKVAIEAELAPLILVLLRFAVTQINLGVLKKRNVLSMDERVRSFVIS